MNIGRGILPERPLNYMAVAVLPIVYAALYLASMPGDVIADGRGAEPASSGQLASDAITPLPTEPDVDPRKVGLGHRLFLDPIMSRSGDISCGSCHDLSAGGDDGLAASIGVSGRQTDVNAPTVLNAALNVAQFWDGRAGSLEAQIDGPLTNPDEMGVSWPEVIPRLAADDNYRAAFGAVYPDGITAANVKNAIAEFERSLITPNARFDRFLRGEKAALNAREKRGYRLFRTYGCISCHQGRNIGGNLFQKLGIVRPYFDDGDGVRKADLGRFNVTGDDADKHVFKVPSLRNVARTAPYFHDGSMATLEDAVAAMGYYQLGRSLDAAAIGDIAAFLATLTGDLPSSLR